MTLVGLGVQTLFGSFFLSVLGLRKNLRLESEAERAAEHEPERERVPV
jgi:hypothetical protein